MPLPAVIHWMSPAPMRALIAQAVAVLDRAGQHVRDGFDAAMRVPREAFEIVLRGSLRKSSSSRNGSKSAVSAEPERATQLDARALHGWCGLDGAFHGSNRHVRLLGLELRTLVRACRCPGSVYRTDQAHPIP